MNLSPLVESGPHQRGGRCLQFRLTGPRVEHRGFRLPAQLVIPCELSNLDACLASLPQDKKQMGLRINIWTPAPHPMLLKPTGNWAEGRVSRKKGKRVGWKPTPWWITPQGIASGGARRLVGWSRRVDGEGLPTDLRFAQLLAEACVRFNKEPGRVFEQSEDAGSCMICGRPLFVQASRHLSVGPECIRMLDTFLGVDATVEQIQAEEEAA